MTSKQTKLIETIRAEIEASDYSEPVAYVDVPAWARARRWSIATTRGVYASLVREGMMATDADIDSLGASRAAMLSERDGGYSGSVPTCWFPR